MKKYGISRFAAVLALVGLSLTTVDASAAQADNRTTDEQVAIVAMVGDRPVSRFEVANIANSMMPMGGFHASGDDGKVDEYWEMAMKTAIEQTLLQTYLETERPELVAAAEDDAGVVIARIRDRFADEAEFSAALAEQGVDRNLFEAAQVRLRLVRLFEDSVKARKVEDKLLEEYFKDNPEMFQTGPSVMTSLCLVAADGRTLSGEEMTEQRRIAMQTLERLRGGEAPADIDACATDIYPESEQVYRFSRGYPSEEILGMEIGTWNGPFEVLYGYLIVRADEKRASETIPFDEIEGQIRSILQENRYRETYRTIMGDMRDEITVTILDDSTGAPAAR